MLAKVAYYLKLSAWGVLAGACCVAALLANYRAAALPEGEALVRVPTQRIAAEYCEYHSPPATDYVTTTHAANGATSARDSEFSVGPRYGESPVLCETTRGGEFVAEMPAAPTEPAEPPGGQVDPLYAETMASTSMNSRHAEISAPSIPASTWSSDRSNDQPIRPAPLTKKRHYDREWTVRDPLSNATLATVKVLGEIDTGRINSDVESATTSKTRVNAVDEPRRSPVAPLRLTLGQVETAPIEPNEPEPNEPETNRAAVETGLADKTGLAVEQDAGTPELFIAAGASVDAADVDIHQLAADLSLGLSLPIEYHPEFFGDGSGRMEARTLEDVLIELVTPFGYSVHRKNGGLHIVMTDANTMTTAQFVATAPVGSASTMLAEPAEAAELIVQASTDIAAGPSPLADLVDASQTPGTVRLAAVEDTDFVVEAPNSRESTATPSPTSKCDEFVVLAIRRAKAAIQEGDLSASIEVLTEAALQQPESLVLFRMLGEAYMHRQDFAAAEKAIQTALAINKFDPLTNRIYSELLTHMKQPERALHYLEQAQHFESNSF